MTANLIPKIKRRRVAGSILVDKVYIREQATQALKTYFAPLSGVYEAAFGPISSKAEPLPPRKPKSGTKVRVF